MPEAIPRNDSIFSSVPTPYAVRSGRPCMLLQESHSCSRTRCEPKGRQERNTLGSRTSGSPRAERTIYWHTTHHTHRGAHCTCRATRERVHCAIVCRCDRSWSLFVRRRSRCSSGLRRNRCRRSSMLRRNPRIARICRRYRRPCGGRGDRAVQDEQSHAS